MTPTASGPTQVTHDIAADALVTLPRLWGLRDYTMARVPCNHPCSLMRADLDKLRLSAHWVGPKTDGVRTFMLLSFLDERDYAVFVERTGYVSRVGDVGVPSDAYSGTLLDGELVTRADGTQTYLVFDCISANGFLMVDKPQSERMNAAARIVFSLTNKSLRLKFEMKKWYRFGNVDLVEVMRAHDTPTDGLIIVPERGARVRPGQQRDHFKWKPASQHTIDMGWVDGSLFLEDRGEVVPASVIGVGVVDDSISIPTGSVVECAMTRTDADVWVATFVRARPDKLHPNDVRIARLTLQNIVEAITLDQLG